MKNIIITVFAFVLLTNVAHGQDTESSSVLSKKGYPLLPETGEWGLGISADPFLRYAGNFLSGSTSTNIEPNFTYPESVIGNNIALFGKKIIDANTAYRARFNVGVGQNINKAVIGQNVTTPDPSAPAFVDDWQKVNFTTVVFSGGYEKRRGNSRVQGIYGGEVVLGLTGNKAVYQYGNTMNLEFNAPITNNFGNNILAGSTAATSSRKTEEKFGTSFLVGARGFVGVEYFFAPKMSIGGEFGYMIGYRTIGKTYITSESWDSAAGAVRTIKTERYDNGGFQSLGIGLDNLNGTINLMFYF